MTFKEWQEFLDNLEEICRYRLNHGGREHYEVLQVPLGKVIRDLKSSDAEAAVNFAAATALRNKDDGNLLGLVDDEMKFFDSLIVATRDSRSNQTMTIVG